MKKKFTVISLLIVLLSHVNAHNFNVEFGLGASGLREKTTWVYKFVGEQQASEDNSKTIIYVTPSAYFQVGYKLENFLEFAGLTVRGGIYNNKNTYDNLLMWDKSKNHKLARKININGFVGGGWLPTKRIMLSLKWLFGAARYENILNSKEGQNIFKKSKWGANFAGALGLNYYFSKRVGLKAELFLEYSPNFKFKNPEIEKEIEGQKSQLKINNFEFALRPGLSLSICIQI